MFQCYRSDSAGALYSMLTFHTVYSLLANCILYNVCNTSILYNAIQLVHCVYCYSCRSVRVGRGRQAVLRFLERVLRRQPGSLPPQDSQGPSATGLVFDAVVTRVTVISQCRYFRELLQGKLITYRRVVVFRFKKSLGFLTLLYHTHCFLVLLFHSAVITCYTVPLFLSVIISPDFIFIVLFHGVVIT